MTLLELMERMHGDPLSLRLGNGTGRTMRWGCGCKAGEDRQGVWAEPCGRHLQEVFERWEQQSRWAERVLVKSRAAEMAEAIAEAERTDADDGHVVRLPLSRDEWLEAEYAGHNLTGAVGSPYR